MNNTENVIDIEEFKQNIRSRSTSTTSFSQPVNENEIQLYAWLSNIKKYYPEIDATYIEILYNVFREIFATNLMAASARGENTMDWQEKYLDKLDRDIGEMKNSLRSTEERIAQMVNQTLSEMRDRDNQRHAEISALRNDIQAIRADNAKTRNSVIGMVISAIGVALAAIIGIVSIVYQILK